MNLFALQSALDELTACEFCERQISTHGFIERVARAMHLQHQRNGRCGGPRTAITAVPYAAPQTVLIALLTYLPVAKEGRCRTQQPVVVQRLQHGHARLAAGLEYRRRDH